MALTHALSTNNYGNPKFIVATSAANGTHTTLATAMADASSGDTIALRDSVTENVTITPGVNIISLSAGGSLNVPSITGTLTMTGAGTSTISGLLLITNSAAIIAITGSAASILNVNNCYLNCSNTTGITFSTSNAACTLNITNCMGDIGTTGIAFFTHTSLGNLNIKNCAFNNTGGSSTPNTCSSGTVNLTQSFFGNPVTISGTGQTTTEYCHFDMGGNVTCMTLNGNGALYIRYSQFFSNSASAISIAGTSVFIFNQVDSSNTNTITGAGALQYAFIAFTNSSSGVNVSTVTPLATLI